MRICSCVCAVSGRAEVIGAAKLMLAAACVVIPEIVVEEPGFPGYLLWVVDIELQREPCGAIGV